MKRINTGNLREETKCMLDITDGYSGPDDPLVNAIKLLSIIAMSLCDKYELLAHEAVEAGFEFEEDEDKLTVKEEDDADPLDIYGSRYS